MWVPKTTFELFHISKDTVNSLREEVAALKVERDSLKEQVQKAQILGDWLRIQINTLQIERTALMEKAYNIRVPSPELVRAAPVVPENDLGEFSFQDIGDALAKKWGYPLHNDGTDN